LAQAFKASVLRADDVCFPIRATEAEICLGLNLDSTIHDWDKVSVCNEIQYAASPGAINTGK
jgi:hypothetical protein